MASLNGTDKPPKPPNAGKGRQKGSLNKATVIKQNISDVFKTFMGIDDEAVAETGRINPQGLKVRKRFMAIAAGERTADPNYTNFMRFVTAYAFGTPLKMQPAGSERRSLNFITANGLPWQNDPLAQKERELLAAQERDDLLAAEQRALEAANPVADEGDDMSLVR